MPEPLFPIVRIYTRSYPEKSVPARPHRRKRIHKKWLKRYGYVRVILPYDPEEVLYRSNGDIYVYPESKERLTQAILARLNGKQGMPLYGEVPHGH